MEQIEAALNEAEIERRIEAPIDEVATELLDSQEPEFSHETFHRILTSFIQTLYERAFPCRRVLSEAQAHDEAVALLAACYPAPSRDGYTAALLDAAHPTHGGIKSVLLRLAEAVKARERTRYVRSVACRHIDPGDWATNSAIAAILLERSKCYLPPELAACHPEQLVDHVFDLLAMDLGTDRPLKDTPS
jgi:hypothetical protein